MQSSIEPAHSHLRTLPYRYNMPTAPPHTPTPPLLCLPLELRQQIYAHILPHTISLPAPPAARPEYNLTYIRPAPGGSSGGGSGRWKLANTSPHSRASGYDTVWRRGCTALLCVNRQVHDEAAEMVYGRNVFVLDVTFQGVSLRYRWRGENGVTPGRTLDWVGHFSARNLRRVRRCVVNVESVDEYTGMVKYNVGGLGLPAGIRGRVRELVEVLGLVDGLHFLWVHLVDGDVSRQRFPSGRVHRVQDESCYAQTQTVLEPFKALWGVRQVRVTGVSEEYAKALEVSMAARRGAAHA